MISQVKGDKGRTGAVEGVSNQIFVITPTHTELKVSLTPALPKSSGFLLLRDFFFQTPQSDASALVSVSFAHGEVLFLYLF